MADKEVSIWIRAKDAASGVFQKVERSMQATVRVARNATKMLLTTGAAAAGAIAGLQRMGAAGARNLAAQSAFNEMAEGRGTAAIEGLKAATRGLVDEQTLMVQSNLALTTGAAKTTDEFARITEQATLLGRAVGLNATEAVEKYTIALSRQSIRRLDDLGIIIDTQEAQEKYAASIGKNVSALSEAQKAEAFRTEAMAKADELLTKTGDTTNTTAEAAERMAASIRNLVTQLQNMVAQSESIANFFDLLAAGFQEFADPGSVARSAVAGSVNEINDPRVAGMRLAAETFRRNEAQKEIARLEAEIALYQAEGAADSRLSSQVGMTSDIVRLTPQLEAQRQILEESSREVELLTDRYQTLVNNMGLGGAGGVSGDGFSFGAGFANTTEQARVLLDAVQDTREALTAAENEMMTATTAEEFEKAKEEATELNRQLQMMLDFIEEYGEAQIRLSAGGIAPIGWAQRYDLPNITDEDPTVDRVNPIPVVAKESADALDKLGASVDTFIGDMVDVVSRGTEITTSRVTQMISQIAAQAIGGPLGTAIGFIGGLISGRMRRNERRETVNVRVEEYGPRAQQQLKENRPLNVTNIVETGGNEIERVELELRRRQARDATARIAPGGR